MQATHYLQQFGITEAESKVRILNCNPESTGSTPNMEWVDPSQLPKLTFADHSFNLALCSKVLFMDLTRSEAFQLESLIELTRVAGEVRVFPIVNDNGHPSVYLGPVLQALQEKGFGVELREIKADPNTRKAAEKGALLRVWNPSCAL